MSALWGEVSEVIEVDGLFPGAISRPVTLQSACEDVSSIKLGKHGWFSGRIDNAAREPAPSLCKTGFSSYAFQWISVKNERLEKSETYHRGRKRRFFAHDVVGTISKDGAFGVRRNDIVVKEADERRPRIDELSRIGSYPDRFKFIGDYGQKWERIGNSVPPLLMKAIATQIYHKL